MSTWLVQFGIASPDGCQLYRQAAQVIHTWERWTFILIWAYVEKVYFSNVSEWGSPRNPWTANMLVYHVGGSWPYSQIGTKDWGASSQTEQFHTLQTWIQSGKDLPGVKSDKAKFAKFWWCYPSQWTRVSLQWTRVSLQWAFGLSVNMGALSVDSCPFSEQFCPFSEHVCPFSEQFCPFSEHVPFQWTVLPVQWTRVPFQWTILPFQWTRVPFQWTVLPFQWTRVPFQWTCLAFLWTAALSVNSSARSVNTCALSVNSSALSVNTHWIRNLESGIPPSNLVGPWGRRKLPQDYIKVALNLSNCTNCTRMKNENDHTDELTR